MVTMLQGFLGLDILVGGAMVWLGAVVVWRKDLQRAPALLLRTYPAPAILLPMTSLARGNLDAEFAAWSWLAIYTFAIVALAQAAAWVAGKNGATPTLDPIPSSRARSVVGGMGLLLGLIVAWIGAGTLGGILE